MPNLKGKVLVGFLWNIVNLIISRGMSFLVKLVLAKLLFPEQFGIVGMATVFTSFVQVFNELGIGAALVQRKEENLREVHYHTAFWTGVVWSVLLYLIISFAVAPLAAAFYDEPMLTKIIPVLSLGVLSSPVNLVHRAQLTKQMNFKRITIIKNTGAIFSGVLALTLAFMGAGVWSLVFNSVASFLIAMPLYFKATGWLPKLQWEKRAFKDVFGFGVYTTGTAVFNNLTSKLDYLLIGKFISASALGAYTFAFILTDLFRSHLMQVINTVMYPVYSKKQEDLAALKKYYLLVIKYNSIVIYPVMVFLLALGEPFIMLFFGDKWYDSVIPTKILAVAVMFHMMVNSNTALIRGLGKPDLEMKLQMFKTIFVFAPAVIIGTYWYGVNGGAMAVLLNKIVAVFIAQYFLKKLVNISFIELIGSLKGPLLGSLVSLIISLILYKLGVHFILCSLSIIISYSLVIWLIMKRELKSQFKNFKNLKKGVATAA